MSGFGSVKDEFNSADIDELVADQEVGLSGASTHGNTALTPADTWVQVPTTAPASSYVLKVSKENEDGVMRWSLDNTTSPATVGERMWVDEASVVLAANQVIYFASSNDGDDVRWSTKII